MPYRLNASVDEQNHHRCHFPENHYIDDLDRRGMLIRVDNVLVDAEQLILRTFECDTDWCVRCKGTGAEKKFKGSCCTDLEVDLTRHEVELLEQLGEMAAQLKIKPSDPIAQAIRRLQKKKFTFLTDEKKELALRQTPHERCMLSWITRDGHYRCIVNTLCDRLGLPIDKYKPDPCFHFPFHYVEHEPGIYFMTTICKETYAWIGADKYVSKLRCLRQPKPGAPPAFRFLKYEIIHCFGEQLYNRLEAAAKPFLVRAGLESPEECACGEEAAC